MKPLPVLALLGVGEGGGAGQFLSLIDLIKPKAIAKQSLLKNGIISKWAN